MRNLLRIIIPMSILFGCGDGNYYDVEIAGIVKDAITKEPISDAEILVQCWVYSTKNWESNTVDKVVTTNDLGEFKVKFKKGEAVDVRIKSQGYNQKEISKTLHKSKIVLEAYLERIE